MYNWLVYVHVLAAFVFMMAHGGSALVAFKIRGEREPQRIRALLELSTYSLNAMYWALLVLFGSGIIAGFMGNWWGRGWIWASLGLLIALAAAMYALGTLYYGKVRKVVGLPYFEGMKQMPPLPLGGPEEVARLLSATFPTRPWLLTFVGVGGLSIILWLMMFKPF